ncbi:MAG: hypothetical protein AAB971_02460 [Patescibacteria group bacterium]
MKELLAIIAALIAIAGNVPYLKDTFAKRVRPHPYTWLVWAIVSGITLFGQIAKGAGVGALPTAVAECFTITIFLFSLQYGFKYVRRTDKYFLIIALLGLIPWLISDDPTISVVIAVSIDLVAFVPTIRKTWRHPGSETPILYGANVLRHVLTLLSLQSYNIATTLHSIAMIITNSVMTGIITLKKSVISSNP